MSPRIRTFVLLLVLGSLLAAPAAASADPWASIFSVPSACPETGPFATLATDTTTVPSGWQNANVNVALTGANTAGFEWKLSCGAAAQTTNPATITGSGIFTFTHRGAGVRHRSPHPLGRRHGADRPDDPGQQHLDLDRVAPRHPVTVPLSIYDDISPVHGEWKLDGAVSYTVGSTASVSRHRHAHALHVRRRRRRQP